MGDRANIYVKQHDHTGDPKPGIYLYTHWGGTELAATLQEALIRGEERWGDEQYLTRIIFSEMVGTGVDENTGFGITTYPCDNGWPLLVVDSKNRQVSVSEFPYDGVETKGLRFEDFVKLSKEELAALREE
jgi:hypothetical protein